MTGLGARLLPVDVCGRSRADGHRSAARNEARLALGRVTVLADGSRRGRGGPRLLDDVGELVGDQRAAVAGRGCVRTRPEEHVAADRECGRAEPPGRGSRRRVGVDPHGGEVVPQPRLERTAGGSIQLLALACWQGAGLPGLKPGRVDQSVRSGGSAARARRLCAPGYVRARPMHVDRHQDVRPAARGSIIRGDTAGRRASTPAAARSAGRAGGRGHPSDPPARQVGC